MRNQNWQDCVGTPMHTPSILIKPTTKTISKLRDLTQQQQHEQLPISLQSMWHTTCSFPLPISDSFEVWYEFFFHLILTAVYQVQLVICIATFVRTVG